MSSPDAEGILGVALPSSAHKHLPHWYRYEGTALRRARERTSRVNLAAERVPFVRAVN